MRTSKIIYVTGGQRSGKSVFAEQLALQLSISPVYLATATIYDDEMVNRVAKHQQRRGDNWQTIEAPLHFDADLTGKTVLLDCITMFATNHYFAAHENVGNAINSIIKEIDKLFSQVDATIIAVSNEIGLGGVSANKMQRQFADLQGTINQYVAQLADEAYMIVSGLPIKLK